MGSGNRGAGRNNTHAMLSRALKLAGLADSKRYGSVFTSDNLDELKRRLSLLAVLLDILPRHQLSKVEAIAEAWNRSFSTRKSVSVEELRAKARAVLRSGRGTGGSRNSRPSSNAIATLDRWKQSLVNDPEWKYLPAIVPGEASVPIDQVFVELFAIPESAHPEHSEAAAENHRTRRKVLAAQLPVVSAMTMASRTLEQCIVLGPPGSGKSTLLHWLARSVAKGESPDFDVALWVKLSVYSEVVVRDKDVSLVEFFLTSLGVKDQDRTEEAAWIRRQAQTTRRFLLLLDGWDEVPLVDRPLVAKHIQKEQPFFATVVTSRPSGAPTQLGGTVSTDYYRMAGLAPKTAKELVANLLSLSGRNDLKSSIQNKVENDLDLREMATNPFLLGLLVRVLANADSEADAPPTLTAMYDQINSWMFKQAQLAGSSPLTSQSFGGLQRLSYELLFRRRTSAYVFSWRELAERVTSESTEHVLRSRLVNQIHQQYDEYGFAHATIQEYYAALYANEFQGSALDVFLEEAFSSSSRLIVLEFLAGVAGEASERLMEFAAKRLAAPDRFRQVLLRTARLVAAGKWKNGVGAAVREELWQEIRSDDEMSLTRAAVEAYVAIDAAELCERVRSAPRLPPFALNCIVEALPVALAQKMNLAELLPGRWQDYAGLELRSEIPEAEMAAMRSIVTAKKASAEKRYEAILFAGAVRDVQAVPALIGTLQNPKFEEALRIETIDSLAAIASREAIDVLVDAVTGDFPLSSGGMMIAAAALRNTPVGRKALDVHGRDKLLRRLAALPPDDPAIEPILAALEGHPIRDGADLIHEFSRREDVSEVVREQAVRTLTTIADRSMLAGVLSTIERQPRKIQNVLLDMAIQRHLPVSTAILREQIPGMKDRVELHQQLKRFATLAARATGTEREMATAFFHSLVVKALGGGGQDSEELCTSLDIALSWGRPDDRLSVGPESAELAKQCLKAFVADPVATAEGPVFLSARVLSHHRDASCAPLLKEAIAAILNVGEDPSRGKRDFRLVSAFVNSLLAIAPIELLRYPETSEPVNLTLKAAAVERGWMIFSDRILDSEGQLIGQIAAPQPSEMTAGEDIALSSRIQLGKKAKENLKLLQILYLLGVEFEKGTSSMNAISEKYENHPTWRLSPGTLSTKRKEIEAFFRANDGTKEPLFKKSRLGRAQVGFTDYGQHAWERTKTFLEANGAVPETD